VQGKTPDAAEQLIRDARAVEAAGAFAVVLEAVPRELAAQITRECASRRSASRRPGCDGQILVVHDLWALRLDRRRNLRASMPTSGNHREGREGILRRCARGTFPSDGESYHAAADVDRTERGAVNSDGDW